MREINRQIRELQMKMQQMRLTLKKIPSATQAHGVRSATILLWQT